MRLRLLLSSVICLIAISGHNCIVPGGLDGVNVGIADDVTLPGAVLGTIGPGLGVGTTDPTLGSGTANPGLGVGTVDPTLATSTINPVFVIDTTVPILPLDIGIVNPGIGVDTVDITVGTGTVIPGLGIDTVDPTFSTGPVTPIPAGETTTLPIPGVGGGVAPSFSLSRGGLRQLVPEPIPPAPETVPSTPSSPSDSSSPPSSPPSSTEPSAPSSSSSPNPTPAASGPSTPSCTSPQVYFKGVCIDCSVQIAGCSTCEVVSEVVLCITCGSSYALDQPDRRACIPCNNIPGCVQCTDREASLTASEPIGPRDLVCTECREGRPPVKGRCRPPKPGPKPCPKPCTKPGSKQGPKPCPKPGPKPKPRPAPGPKP